MTQKAHPDRYFFTATAIWYVLTVFWGFAPSFYLSSFVDDPNELPVHLIVHGFVFTAWVLLYLVQTLLVATRRVHLHRSLGVLGLFLMLGMIPTGIFPSIYKVYANTSSIDGGGHNVFRLMCGYIFFALAFYYRKRPFLHKRFMLACMVMLMSAAIFRLSFDLGLESSQVFNKGMQVFPAVALFVYDLVRQRRVVWVDLFPVATVFAIFFLADYFWLAPAGKWFMDVLIWVFVLPFV